MAYVCGQISKARCNRFALPIGMQIIEYGSRDSDRTACLHECCAYSNALSMAYACVDKYAKLIGSIGGIILSLLLLGLWLGLGKVMGYNNPNWWLIIGTYTGLVRIS